MNGDPLYLLEVMTVMAVVTFATRALPFLFFRNRDPPELLDRVERSLPPMIMLLLVIYCLKDVAWSVPPYGLPEVLSIVAVGILHTWRRNALLSIFAGIALYMFLVRSDILLHLFQ